MNDTSYGPGTPPGPAPSPDPSFQGPSAPRPPHHDLDRLRRSVSDRYIAGVAGGLGRHFGVDPTIIRVLLAVLTLFGGAGVLIYAVTWLFVPEDGKEKAAINVGSEPRKILLLAAVGIAGLLAVGDVFGGFSAGWPVVSIAVIIAVVMIARDRKNPKNTAGPAPWTGGPPPPPPAPTAYAAAPTTYATTEQPPVPPAWQPPAPPAWQPPVGQPPLIPPHAKRTGILWFWPTLALIAIGLGIVGMIDTTHHVDAGVYPAVAVAITGAMLLLGAFVGRPGGLILIGIVSTMTLGAATVLGTFHFDGRDLRSTPKTSAEVQTQYETHMGRIYLDLTKVSDPAALAGRSIDLELNAGEIVVIVPKSLNVDIDAAMGFAGGIKIPGYDGGGVQDTAFRHLVGNPTSTSPPLDLELDVRVGQITVEQR